MEEEKKLFNSGFISITVINFIVFLVYYLLMVIIAVIAQDELGATTGQAGFASGIYIIGTLVARLYIGKKLEVFGRKQVLRYGAVFYLLTTVAYLYTPSLTILYLVRFLNGFAYGAISTAANAIVTYYIPKSRHGEGINYYGLSTSLAAAAGPFLGMILLNNTSFNVIIWVSIGLVALTTVGSFLMPVVNLKIDAAQIALSKKWNLDSFIEKRVLFISGIAFLIGLSYSSVLAFLSTYTKVIHLVEAGSFFFVVYALSVTFTRPASGKIFDKYGEDFVMYPSYIFLTLGLFLLSVTTTSWMLLLSGALIGLGYGTFMSNGQAVCLKHAEGHRIGIALSTYFIGLDLGLGVGPYIMGELRNFLSFSGVYVIAGLIPIVCVVLYKLFYQVTLRITKKVSEKKESFSPFEED